MRIAVVTDIHANLSALDAVIADLRDTRPDLVVHGGDLVGGGSRPAEVIDRIRELRWPGVYGNTDEMLWEPLLVSEKLLGPHLQRIRDGLLTHTIPWTLERIGTERLAFLHGLPKRWAAGDVSVVHAAPDDAWQFTTPNATDDVLGRVFQELASKRVVYGHIHVPFVRHLPAFTLVNAGAVSQSFDGDPRASYALLDEDRIEMRRVEYDVEHEVRLLLKSGDPFAESTAATLRTGRYIS